MVPTLKARMKISRVIADRGHRGRRAHLHSRAPLRDANYPLAHRFMWHALTMRLSGPGSWLVNCMIMRCAPLPSYGCEQLSASTAEIPVPLRPSLARLHDRFPRCDGKKTRRMSPVTRVGRFPVHILLSYAQTNQRKQGQLRVAASCAITCKKESEIPFMPINGHFGADNAKKRAQAKNRINH